MEGVRGSIPLPPTIKIKRLAGSSVGTAHEMPMKQAVGNVFVEDDVRYGRQKTAAMGRKPLRSRSQPTAAVFPSIVLRPWCGMSSEPEHNLAKVGVEGSNPFARSKNSLFLRGPFAPRSQLIRQLSAERNAKSPPQYGENRGTLFTCCSSISSDYTELIIDPSHPDRQRNRSGLTPKCVTASSSDRRSRRDVALAARRRSRPRPLETRHKLPASKLRHPVHSILSYPEVAAALFFWHPQRGMQGNLYAVGVKPWRDRAPRTHPTLGVARPKPSAATANMSNAPTKFARL
jgi:hypothetical protein